MKKEKALKMYKNGELEKMSWEEFLASCDASHYVWTGYSIRPEDPKYRIFEVDIFDDPDVEYVYPSDYLPAPDNEIIIDWGIPVVVTDAGNIGKAYIIVEFVPQEKENYIQYGEFVPVSGELYSTYEEAQQELEEILKQD